MRSGATLKALGKWIGLAGVLGVAATGVVVVRSQRRRAAYTPDQVRERLHLRWAALETGESARDH
ncbi:MAG: hypothetical protein QOJ83_624 [Frankiales bacterium]|jgi:hypothetical protein|nr:hypothetical protein [Frankiales bacterium]